MIVDCLDVDGYADVLVNYSASGTTESICFAVFGHWAEEKLF